MSDDILDYYDYPPREPCEWTMHYHIRGPKILLGEEEGFYIKHPKGNFFITPEGKLKKVKTIPPNAPRHSSHIDFRIDYGDYLIGWTLVTGNTGDDMLKIVEISDKKKMLCLKKEPEPKAWLHITSKKRPIYIAPRGSVGACLSPGTEVLTLHRGLIPIEKIEVGDLVWTHTGSWQRVIQILRTKPETRPVYQVHMKPGQDLFATPEHPWLIAQVKWTHDGKRLTNEIRNIRWWTTEELYQYLNERSTYKWNLYWAIPRTPEGMKGDFAWGELMGFAFGDGYWRRDQIDSSFVEYYLNPKKETDLAYWEHLKEIAESRGATHFKEREHARALRVSFRLKSLWKDLQALYHNPSLALHYTKEWAKGFLKGLVMADGYRNSVTQAKPWVNRVLPLIILHSDSLIGHKIHSNKRGFGKPDSKVHLWTPSTHHLMISKDGHYLLKKVQRVTKFGYIPETFNLTVESAESYFIPNAISHNTKYTEGVFIHLDDGVLWPGTLKPSFVEYFFEGDLLQGRYVIRQTALNVIDPETGKKSTQKWPAFLFWKPKDQIPYICKKRARKKKYVPPKGIVPIAPRHIDEIPDKVYDALLYLLEVWSE